MPEAPDLEVIQEVLSQRIAGLAITRADVLRPTVLRSLAAPDFSAHALGRTVESISRRGKFLFLTFSGDTVLVVNPMLTGTLHLCAPATKLLKRTCFVLGLGDDLELRYLDDKQMGQVYYVSASQFHSVPRLEEQGPDVLSDVVASEEFISRLRRHHGEIKGILTRGTVLSGIGNAYSDEILFAAGISPFRKRSTLSAGDVERLYHCARQVCSEAVVVLRDRMGEDVHHKIRDFLKVHNKGGQPCPRCGNSISQITANQRITSFCRHCQPGSLIRN